MRGPRVDHVDVIIMRIMSQLELLLKMGVNDARSLRVETQENVETKEGQNNCPLLAPLTNR